MIPKLTAKVTANPQRLVALRDAIHKELYATVDKLGLGLEALVKQKLSGPVLKPRTGTLRSSIRHVTEDRNGSIISTVGTSVAEVVYARIHEFGGIIRAKNAPYLVFKTADGAWHKVKEVTMPERSYLRSSLAEYRPTIATQITLALRRARQQAGFTS